MTIPSRLDGSGLTQAMAAARAAPAALPPRMALLQLACIDGDWERARKQLDVIGELDPEAAGFVRSYGGLIMAEAARERVISGSERPVVIGEPPAFVALLIEALSLEAAGSDEAAWGLRRRALDEGDPRPAVIDDTSVGWLMDADLRFGPVLELVVDGGYRWLPVVRLTALRLQPPKDTIDLVWARAEVTLENGGRLHGFVPVRYPGSAAHADPRVRQARITIWAEGPGGVQVGLGQRLLASDVGDHPVLDVREIRMGAGHG